MADNPDNAQQTLSQFDTQTTHDEPASSDTNKPTKTPPPEPTGTTPADAHASDATPPPHQTKMAEQRPVAGGFTVAAISDDIEAALGDTAAFTDTCVALLHGEQPAQELGADLIARLCAHEPRPLTRDEKQVRALQLVELHRVDALPGYELGASMPGLLSDIEAQLELQRRLERTEFIETTRREGRKYARLTDAGRTTLREAAQPETGVWHPDIPVFGDDILHNAALRLKLAALNHGDLTEIKAPCVDAARSVDLVGYRGTRKQVLAEVIGRRDITAPPVTSIEALCTADADTALVVENSQIAREFLSTLADRGAIDIPASIDYSQYSIGQLADRVIPHTTLDSIDAFESLATLLRTPRQ